jgi:hypothetical protein
MDKERKRHLKRLGKELVEKNSASLKQAIAQTNTADFASDEYLRNEIKVRKAEKRLRTKPRLLRVKNAQKSYVLWPSTQPSSPARVFSESDYWHCHECSWLVPGLPTPSTRCKCGNVYTGEVSLIKFDGTIGTMFIFGIGNPVAVELVRLLPKASAKKWWQFWR